MQKSPAKDDALDLSELAPSIQIPFGSSPPSQQHQRQHQRNPTFARMKLDHAAQIDLELQQRLENELSADVQDLSFQPESFNKSTSQHHPSQHQSRPFNDAPPTPFDDTAFSFEFDAAHNLNNMSMLGSAAALDVSATGRRISSTNTFNQSLAKNHHMDPSATSPIPMDDHLRERFDHLLSKELERTDAILQRSAASLTFDSHTDLSDPKTTNSAHYQPQGRRQSTTVNPPQHSRLVADSPPPTNHPRTLPYPHPSIPPIIPPAVTFNSNNRTHSFDQPIITSSKIDKSSSRIMLENSRPVSILDSSRPISTIDGDVSSLGIGEKLHNATVNPPIDLHRPIGNLPEDHSSKAVISALKTLQEKIAHLEKDKENATRHIEDLENELIQAKRQVKEHVDGVQRASPSSRGRDSSKNDLMLEKLRLENLLASSNSQANLLERQLEYSRKMAQDAISERDQALQNLEQIRREIAILRASTLKHAGAAMVSASTSTTPVGQSMSTRVEVSDSDKVPCQSATTHPAAAASRNAKMDDEPSFLQKEDVDLLRREIDETRSKVSTMGMNGVSADDEEKLKQLLLEKALKRSRKIVPGKSARSSKATTAVNTENTTAVKPSDVPKITRPAPAAERQVPTWKRVDVRLANGTVNNGFYQKHAKSSRKVEAASINTPSPPLIQHDELVPVKKGKDLPFIIGTSAGKSYSVTANLQKVYSMLKNHNPQLCSVCRRKHSGKRKQEDDGGRDEGWRWCNGANDINHDQSSPVQPSSGKSLVKVLSLLEDEFNHLKMHYQNLVTRYEEAAESTGRGRHHLPGSLGCDSNRTLRVLGDDLRDIIQSMEIKGDQISIIREIVNSTNATRATLHFDEDLAELHNYNHHHHHHHHHGENNRARKERRGGDGIPFPRMRSRSHPPVIDEEGRRGRARSRSAERKTHLANLGLLKSSIKVQNQLA
ncbi:hypothetical protein SeMB42_g01750 [Synchytrium endobioticum]|uniref:Cep57 centrosome microtubule-binding domain-containing protein n=1 Tax=Synchytrium endobioticum TaxID=286115 RepID=A0A507CZF2_9FUNG|nr:hypothetical protein SeLEV6574_g04441 [Synchytrium endobioticum]TPX51951.1 hypothetical protein SeMB42_g01750 [Synchytrium endobioticum]